MKRGFLLSLVTVLTLASSAGGAHAAGKDSYAAGRFAMSIDGLATGYVRKATGGSVKGEVVSHSLGGGNFQKKHLATISHEPLTLELDLSMGEPIWDWLKSSLDHGHEMRNLAIVSDDLPTTQLRREFHDAVITAVTFPALDGSSKDPCYLTVTAEAQTTQYQLGKSDTKTEQTPAGKPWACSNFRIEIDGLPTDSVSKISAITVTQPIPDDPVGSSRRAAAASVATVTNITFTIAMHDFEEWFAWFESFVIDGKCTDQDEKTGSLEFLDASFGEAMARLDLGHIGIVAIEPHASSNAEGVARFDVELYVETVAFEHFGS